MVGSLMTGREFENLSWSIHNAAANQAKAAGACLRCSAEMGHRATDEAGLSRRTRNDYEMHGQCAKRIGIAK